MSASTATVSPRTRLTGNRPHSSSGFTPRMTTRSGGRSLIFRAYHGPLTPLVLSPISEGCEGARHFLRADRIQIRFASRLLLPGDPVSNSNDPLTNDAFPQVNSSQLASGASASRPPSIPLQQAVDRACGLPYSASCQQKG